MKDQYKVSLFEKVEILRDRIEFKFNLKQSYRPLFSSIFTAILCALMIYSVYVFMPVPSYGIEYKLAVILLLWAWGYLSSTWDLARFLSGDWQK